MTITEFTYLPPSGGVSSIDSLTGDLTFIAGTGMTITPSGSTITFSASGGANAPLTLTGSTDVVQLTVKANGTQTANIQEWKTSGGSVLCAIEPDGSVDTNTVKTKAGSEILDILNGAAYSPTGDLRVDWGNAALKFGGGLSIDWGGRSLWGAGSNVFSWGNGTPQFPNLASSFGTTVGVDFSNNLIMNTSSLRFKEDVQPTSTYLGKNLVARDYHRKTSPDGMREVGLIAEEAALIIPEVVIFDKEGAPFSINFNAAIAVLFSKIGELEDLLNTALRELSDLKNAG